MSLQKLLVILAVGLLLSLSRLQAKGLVFSDAQIIEISHLAKDISVLQPGLPKMKYFEFAIGIFEACDKYGIDPQLLAAITAQESSFRENLPEGAAGEYGMTQIRKNWLKDKTFRTEFPKASQASLNQASSSFKYSAWLLSHLKISRTPKKLPYWTYYNSVSYAPRFRYYLRVNKRLGKIRRLKAQRLAKMSKLTQKRSVASVRTAPKATAKAKTKRKPLRFAKFVKKTNKKQFRKKSKRTVRKLKPKKRSITRMSASQKRRGIERDRQRRLAKVHARKQRRALQALRKKRIAPVLAVAKPKTVASISFGKPKKAKKRRVRRVRRSQIDMPQATEQPAKTGYLSAALKDVNREYQKRQERYEDSGIIRTTLTPASLSTRSGGIGYVAPAVRGTANQLGISGAY